MNVSTARFGNIEIPEDKIIEFPDGLYGFEAHRRFTLLDMDSGPNLLKWMQSIEDPDLAFVVCDPYAFVPSYDPILPAGDLQRLGISDPRDAALLAILVVPRDIRNLTANLQAPLIINPETRRGKQVILGQVEWSTKFYLFRELGRLTGKVKRTG